MNGITDYIWGGRMTNSLSNQKLNRTSHVNTNGEIIKMFGKTTFSQGSTKDIE